MSRMPVVFSGHGDPMIALRDDEITRGMRQVGQDVIERHGKPKAMLAISAHWYTAGTFVQSAPQPRQVYDMYGFPQELYDLKYPAAGHPELSERVQALLGDRVSVDDSWGVDHGAWTVLVHMFPEADVPVVQLSVDSMLDGDEILQIGRSLATLRDEGYLIFGSGNIVHNLRRVEWGNPQGTPVARRYNRAVVDAVLAGEVDKVADYDSFENASYAVPTPEHYLPLVYCVGAADGDEPAVFNNICNLGSMAMTGFTFGM